MRPEFSSLWNPSNLLVTMDSQQFQFNVPLFSWHIIGTVTVKCKNILNWYTFPLHNCTKDCSSSVAVRLHSDWFSVFERCCIRHEDSLSLILIVDWFKNFMEILLCYIQDFAISKYTVCLPHCITHRGNNGKPFDKIVNTADCSDCIVVRSDKCHKRRL